jgi:uncharacterized protein YggE
MFNQFFGEEGAKRASKWTVSVLFFLSVFLVVQILGDLKRLPTIGRDIYPQSTISVSGSGEAYAIPDIATFNFTVTETAATVSAAQESADEKVNAALSVIRDSGVEDKDIKTTGYNVYPKYEYSRVSCAEPMIGGAPVYCPPSKQVLTGYEVSQTITVKVRKTEQAGELVTAVGGVEVSNISGVEFGVDDREHYVAEAREQAIAEAKEKAKVLAKQLGVRLGKIMYYNENGGYPYKAEGLGGAYDMAVSSVAPRAAELPTGETKITSDISITYEIK